MVATGSRRVAFAYLFSVYLLLAASETFISPLFPLIRADLGLQVSDQAGLTAVLTACIGIGNVAGGWAGVRWGDRVAVRAAASLVAVGAATCGVSSGILLLYVGQALTGLGVGLFFGPGLAVVGRMYVEARGRAIASYGLAYSFGLALASVLSNVGVSLWRAVFLVTAVLAAGLAAAPPQLQQASPGPRMTFWREARAYARERTYRFALATGVAAGATHYVVIGLAPEHFVGRGASLALVTGLVAAGRLASVGGKVISGMGVDRVGGPFTARLLLAGVVVLGAAVVLPPGTGGLWALAPFVCVTAMLFPVSNAIVILALPDNASWGVGLYRAGLMLASAACAGVVSLVLRWSSTGVVMAVALCLPLLVGLTGRRAMDLHRGARSAAPAATGGGERLADDGRPVPEAERR